MESSQPYLTIIIPAYNEEYRLPGALEKILQWIQGVSYTLEVIVVENGSVDNTTAIAESYIPRFPALRVLHSAKGKGAAVRHGIMQSQGELLFICDCDLSMPIDQVIRLIEPCHEEFDVAIASREADGAKRYDEPNYRHWMGRVFNFLVQVLAVSGFRDTQCGFKLMTRRAALDVFALQTIDGWTFDVEFLYIACKREYRICEVPIDWYFDSDSRVRPLHDTWHMFVDILRIRWNDFTGRYDGVTGSWRSVDAIDMKQSVPRNK